MFFKGCFIGVFLSFEKIVLENFESKWLYLLQFY